jgi:uncharacterized protein
VPLFAEEAATAPVERVYESDLEVVVWWATEIECASAISRKERDGVLAPPQALAALRKLESLQLSWQELQPSEAVRGTARRLLRVHPLRAADALQLAAAIAAVEGDPSSLQLVTRDERLADAATREGFPVLLPQ